MKSKMTRVTVTLPPELLEAADAKLAEDDESRSSMIRRLIETALKEAQERKDVEQWIQSYREHPQSEDDLGWVTEVSLEQLRKVPWE